MVSDDPSAEQAKDRLEAFLSGLEALPPSPGLSWRGRVGAALPPGTIVTGLLLDASRDLRVATDNFSVPAAFALFGLTGRDLAPFSANPGAAEIVFLPARVLTVGETTVVDGLEVTIVVERLVHDGQIEELADLDERIAALHEHVRQARMLAPVQVEAAERFRGTLE